MGGLTGKRLKETFRDDVLCLDCSDDYTDVHICQNSSDHTLKVGAIYRMKLYRNIFEIKKERNSTHFSSIDYKGEKVKQKRERIIYMFLRNPLSFISVYLYANSCSWYV